MDIALRSLALDRLWAAADAAGATLPKTLTAAREHLAQINSPLDLGELGADLAAAVERHLGDPAKLGAAVTKIVESHLRDDLRAKAHSAVSDFADLVIERLVVANLGTIAKEFNTALQPQFDEMARLLPLLPPDLMVDRPRNWEADGVDALKNWSDFKTAARPVEAVLAYVLAWYDPWKPSDWPHGASWGIFCFLDLSEVKGPADPTPRLSGQRPGLYKGENIHGLRWFAALPPVKLRLLTPQEAAESWEQVRRRQVAWARKWSMKQY